MFATLDDKKSHFEDEAAPVDSPSEHNAPVISTTGIVWLHMA